MHSNKFRALWLTLWLIFGLSTQSFAAVAYDSNAHQTNAGSGGSGSIPSFNISVVTATNVACAIGIYIRFADTISSVTVGGVTASLISNTTSSDGHIQLYGAALGNTNGTKAVVVSAPSATSDLAANVICATGVDQVTPFNNGNKNSTGFSAGVMNFNSPGVTSTSGDLIVAFGFDWTGSAATAPTNVTVPSGAAFTDGDICAGGATCLTGGYGDGTGTANPQWTTPSGDGWSITGVNFVAATGGGGGGGGGASCTDASRRGGITTMGAGCDDIDVTPRFFLPF